MIKQLFVRPAEHSAAMANEQMSGGTVAPSGLMCQAPPYWAVTLARSGETIDSLAIDMAEAFPDLVRGKEQARAIIIENNGLSSPTKIRAGQAVQVAPFRCDKPTAVCWSAQAADIQADLGSLSGPARTLFEEQANLAPTILALSEEAESAGWNLDLDEVLKFVNYGVSGGSGWAAAGMSELNRIQKLTAQIVADARRILGVEVVTSKKAADLARLESFLKGHHQYGALQSAIQKLPGFLKGRLGNVQPTAGINSAAARWLRRQFVIPASKMASAGRYVNTMAGRVARETKIFGRVGVGTTWVIPAAMGLWSVYEAPSYQRPRVAFQETTGILLGAAGTSIGIFMGTTLAVFLCLTGVGAFVVIALAGAAMGTVFYERAKSGAGELFDIFHP